VTVRVFLPPASQPNGRISGKAEFAAVQLLLAGENQRGRKSASGKRMCDGGQFDCFGPGPDDQPNFGRVQPSP